MSTDPRNFDAKSGHLSHQSDDPSHEDQGELKLNKIMYIWLWHTGMYWHWIMLDIRKGEKNLHQYYVKHL